MNFLNSVVWPIIEKELKVFECHLEKIGVEQLELLLVELIKFFEGRLNVHGLLNEKKLGHIGDDNA